MSLSFYHKILRSAETCSKSLHPKMCVNTENPADASETRGAEVIDKSIYRISPDQLKKRSKPT